jgi:hypothetical protein
MGNGMLTLIDAEHTAAVETNPEILLAGTYLANQL